MISQVLEHGIAAGKKAKKEAAYRHVGASGRVYTSDHPITPKERKQIDDYDLAYEVPKKAGKAVTAVLTGGPRKPLLKEEMDKQGREYVANKQGMSLEDHEKTIAGIEGDRQDYIAKYGVDPRTEPAKYAQTESARLQKEIKGAVAPVVEPLGEATLNTFPLYWLAKATGLVKPGDAGRVAAEGAASIINTPNDVALDTMVQWSPYSKPEERVRATANQVLNLGGADAAIAAGVKGIGKALKKGVSVVNDVKGAGKSAGDAFERALGQAEGSGFSKVEAPPIEAGKPATKAAKKQAQGPPPKAQAEPKTAEPRKGKAEAPVVEPKKGQGVTHEDVDALRNEIGWQPRSGERKPDTDLIKEAKKHAGREEQIAQGVLDNKKKTLTDDESLALGQRLRQLVDERKAAKVADDAEGFLFADDAAQKIADALDESGSRQGRAFRARQFASVDDDVWTLTRNLEKKIKDGEIKEGSRSADKIKSLIKELEDSEIKRSELEAKLAASEAGTNGDVVVTQIAKGREKIGTRSKDAIRAERDEILKDLAGIGSKLSANPIFETAEGIKLVGRLAVNYIEEGVTTLAEVAAKIRSHGIEATDHEVYEALIYKEPKAARPNEAARRVADLRKQADLILQINEVIGGGTPTKGARPPVPSETIAGLRKALEDVKRITGTPTERSQAKRLQQAIDDALEQIKTGEKPVKEKSPTILDAESRALKQKLEKVREELSVKDIEAEIADLQRQLDTSNFTPRKSKEARKLSKEIANLQAERDLYRGKVLAAMKNASTPFVTKAAKFVAGNVRGAILGSDIGVLTRQGLFGLARPMAFVKSVGKGLKSALSEKALAKIERELIDREINGEKAGVIYKRIGLSLTDHLTNPEELVIGTIFKKIPGLHYLAGAGERFQSAFINTLRAESLDRAIRLGFKENELKARANFINAATGRGNVKSVPTALEFVLTSPRYEASRWQMLTQPLRNPAVILKDLATGKGLNRGALQNIQDMAVTAAEIYGLYKLAESSGYEVNFDGTSSDFLKMRRGNEVWDPTAGIAPRLRDAIRIVAFGMEPGTKENFTKALGDMVVRPISPVVRQSTEAASTAYQRGHGVNEKDIKSFFTGFTLEEDKQGWIAFSPLIFQTAKKYLDQGDVEGAMSAAAREFIGQSVNQYPKPKAKK